MFPDGSAQAPDTPRLENGSRVAVIGGGPAGSLFSYFLLQAATRVGVDLTVDIYEPRDFHVSGPAGCNMCGGVISETLVQHLATEGITLPETVVERGIDCYALHLDVGSVRIETPLHEKRIAAVHRGAGPRGIASPNPCGFDAFLLALAQSHGARHLRQRVESVNRVGGKPLVRAQGGASATYDLVAIATGVNGPNAKLVQSLDLPYREPPSTKTYICEFLLGRETVQATLGSAMHVFLPHLPRLEFAAIIPKGEFATLCVLGHDIDKAIIREFLELPEVRECMPPGWEPPVDLCHCSPRISTGPALVPYADRLVFVGDCGTTRLYKDGLGAAYRTAKAAAKTAIFHGVGARDFQQHFAPTCDSIAHDNWLGRLVFVVTRVIQHNRLLRRGLWRMVSREQGVSGAERRMSIVLWDTFTGSAPYREVVLRTLHPHFLLRFLWEIAAAGFERSADWRTHASHAR